MGRKCEVEFCNNAVGRTIAKSFYCFPRNPEVCSKWVEFCKNVELEKKFQDGGVAAIRSRKICSDHFRDSDFVNPRKTSQGIRTFAHPVELDIASDGHRSTVLFDAQEEQNAGPSWRNKTTLCLTGDEQDVLDAELGYEIILSTASDGQVLMANGLADRSSVLTDEQEEQNAGPSWRNKTTLCPTGDDQDVLDDEMDHDYVNPRHTSQGIRTFAHPVELDIGSDGHRSTVLFDAQEEQNAGPSWRNKTTLCLTGDEQDVLDAELGYEIILSTASDGQVLMANGLADRSSVLTDEQEEQNAGPSWRNKTTLCPTGDDQDVLDDEMDHDYVNPRQTSQGIRTFAHPVELDIASDGHRSTVLSDEPDEQNHDPSSRNKTTHNEQNVLEDEMDPEATLSIMIDGQDVFANGLVDRSSFLPDDVEIMKAKLESALHDKKILQSKLTKEKRKSSWRLKSMETKDKQISALKTKIRINEKTKSADSKLAALVRRNPVIHNSLTNSTKKPNGRRYNASTKKFACGTYMAGPAAYRFIRKSKTLSLPSKRTIGRWNADFRTQPGINLDLLDKVAGKTKGFSKKERAVMIAIDGIKIKADLTYNAKTDTFHGFPSDGKRRKFEKNQPLKLATEAVAVVVSSLSTLNSDRWELEETSRRFKIPIGYLLAHHTMGSEAQLSMLEDVVEQLECRGLFPLVVTIDQCQTNMKMAREAGMTKKNPIIRVNNTKMALIFDPPHLLKSVRNNFMKHNLVFKNKICSFDVLKRLYEIDQASTPRLVPKLVEHCVNLPPFGAMSVPRAAATISSSCATGIEFYVETGELHPESLATADMLKFHDTLFDVMNSKGLNSAKPYRRALENDSCHWRFMKQAEILLKEMYYTTNTCDSIAEALEESKTLTVKQRKPNYMQGFINNIRALRWLWTRLSKEFEFEYLCTNHISSDTVENFNSDVRRRCGRNDAPNAYEYSNAFKYSAISATQKLAEGSNCEQDNAQPLLQDADIIRNIKHAEPETDFQYTYEPLDESYDRGYTLKELNGLMYIVGYAALKLPHKRCRKYLYIQSDSAAHHKLLHKFCELKQASIYPNSKLYEIGLCAFNAYKQKFNRFLYQNRRHVKARLKEFVRYEAYEKYTCKKCFEMIVDKIFNILIKSFLKEVRNALKKKNVAQRHISAEKRNRKAIKMDLP